MSYVLAIRKQDSIHPLSHEKVVYPLLENAAPDFCHCGIPSENSKIPVFGLKILMRIKRREKRKRFTPHPSRLPIIDYQ